MASQSHNLVGERYGNWMVLGEASGSHHARRFLCRCDCGAEHLMYHGNLLRAAKSADGGCRSCAAKGRPRVNRIGMQFGLWTVLREVERYDSTIKYLCRCSCGNERKLYYSNLATGMSTQCRDCQHRSMVKWVPGTVIGKNVVLARKGKTAKLACTHCGRKRWARVSKYNIGCVCGRRPPPPDTYGRMLTLRGETHNMAGWARKLGISREAVRLRLEKGMQLEMALTAPRTYRGGPPSARA